MMFNIIVLFLSANMILLSIYFVGVQNGKREVINRYAAIYEMLQREEIIK